MAISNNACPTCSDLFYYSAASSSYGATVKGIFNFIKLSGISGNRPISFSDWTNCNNRMVLALNDTTDNTFQIRFTNIGLTNHRLGPRAYGLYVIDGGIVVVSWWWFRGD